MFSVMNSPSLGLPSELYAQIIIEQNDYAQGVLEFAIDAISVPEHTPGPFVQVKRTAGTFGQVSNTLCSVWLTHWGLVMNLN